MSQKNSLWTILIVAIIVRFAYSLSLYFSMGSEGFFAEDSLLYIELAKNFISHGDFLREVGTEGTLIPETERMPLYIIWLAIHQFVTGDLAPLFPVLTQGLLDSLACIFISLTAKLINPRLMLPAGLLAACNPTQVVIGGMILTDSLFFFFVCLMFYASIKWLYQPNYRWALLLGLALGLGISTRAMLLPGMVAIIVLLPTATVILRRFKFSQLGHMAVILGLSIVLQSPILARNTNLYNSVQLTSQNGTHLLLWVAPLVLEAADGTPHAEGAVRMQTKFKEFTGTYDHQNPFERSNLMSSIAWSSISEIGIIQATKSWLIGGAINIFSPAALLSPPVRDLPRTGFFDTKGENKLDKVFAFLFHNDQPIYTTILIIALTLVFLVRILQLLGVSQGLCNKSNREIQIIYTLFIFWILYILIIHGPVASPKYRLPIEPIFSIWAAMPLISILERIKSFSLKKPIQ